MQADGQACKASRKDGAPCRVTALLPDGYCFVHSPANQAAQRAARTAGGHAKAKSARAEKLVPASLRPVLERLLDALEETHTGKLDARQASAIASLAGAIVRVYQAGTLEERVAALEQGRPEG